jgi:hypothetical protein
MIEQLECRNCGHRWLRDTRWRDVPINCLECGRRELLPETTQEKRERQIVYALCRMCRAADRVIAGDTDAKVWVDTWQKAHSKLSKEWLAEEEGWEASR